METANTLKEIRKRGNITQKEAAILTGVSLRTYKEYENSSEKRDSFKYKAILNILSSLYQIDEEHGILKIDEIKETVTNILNKYNVNFCYLFGSYAKGHPTEASDVDLLIDSSLTGLDFFGLIEELRETLHKKVDLLNMDQIVNNKDLLKEILKTGIKIYG